MQQSRAVKRSRCSSTRRAEPALSLACIFISLKNQLRKMGLWILETEKTRATRVPGTCLLDDLHAVTAVSDADQAAAANLKRDKNGVVLVPQPSDDPRDPLNWPRLKKELCFFNMYALKVCLLSSMRSLSFQPVCHCSCRGHWPAHLVRTAKSPASHADTKILTGPDLFR